jgi:hypothetical protein
MAQLPYLHLTNVLAYLFAVKVRVQKQSASACIFASVDAYAHAVNMMMPTAKSCNLLNALARLHVWHGKLKGHYSWVEY